MKLAFAKTTFDYIEKELPGIDMVSYKKRVLREYRAIVARTPGIGKMKDNMFVMTMYAGAFLIGKKTGRPCPRGGLLSADGESKAGKERVYGKGDREPNEAGKMVKRSYRGIPDELVLLF